MTKPTDLPTQLRLPAMQAPMFLISGPDMVINACRAGIIGCFPTPNARTTETLDEWMGQITEALKPQDAPWAVNLIVHPSYPRRDADLELILKHKPPVVVTALGSPRHVVEQIHNYGGLVLADVINPTFARKAASAGVDGLVLVSTGAGGHTGYLSPFVFINEIRQWWDGLIVLGGGISTGRDIHAVQTMGADIAYIGTRFIATDEGLCKTEYKQMVVDSGADDIVTSDAITGVKANWMRQSLIKGGYDPDNMPAKGSVDFASNGADNKRWKDIWAAGQGVGATRAIEKIANIVDQLDLEYRASKERMQQL
ncbi:nitronate monooxygenase [Pseudomaricurvus alkylphenolicus]|uniref:NAD(P)H-dependent flavin oxidoreductase n=1 Tax=Pseudomaricurvus alkylphenolicus TaxID=1306991 RepID=UPI001423DF34|nr:nitronate monooxygenase [Pseudomaricurvus alkylphenolicus]NIB43339.1 nitronate monooxygenase [Pseudomaricurvus alkylphenolicus]